MKHKLVADLHLWPYLPWGGAAGALNDRALHQLAVLRRLGQLEPEARTIVAGDVFDRSGAEPQLETGTRDVMSTWAGTTLLVGNHDQRSDAPGDHALGPLFCDAHSGDVDVIERPVALTVGNATFYCMPYRDGVAAWLPGQLASLVGQEQAQSTRRVLVLHCGIVDGSTPPWLRDGSNAINILVLEALARQHGIELVVSGDWHEHRRWSYDGLEIAQLGTLLPHSFSDAAAAQPYGRVVVWDDDDGSVRVVELAGPRFVSATPADLDDRLDAITATGEDLRVYVSVLARPAERETVRVRLVDLQAQGVVTAWRVVTDDQPGVEARKAARVSGQREQSVDQALQAYVAELLLPEGVVESAVLARAREHLRHA